eukprot:COSAG01_NODE_23537_length_811_cov_1.977528_2_plen_101_part_00
MCTTRAAPLPATWTSSPWMIDRVRATRCRRRRRRYLPACTPACLRREMHSPHRAVGQSTTPPWLLAERRQAEQQQADWAKWNRRRQSASNIFGGGAAIAP